MENTMMGDRLMQIAPLQACLQKIHTVMKATIQNYNLSIINCHYHFYYHHHFHCLL